jgi:hypothetical protein
MCEREIERLLKRMENDCKYKGRGGSCLTGNRSSCNVPPDLCPDYKPKEVKK